MRTGAFIVILAAMSVAAVETATTRPRRARPARPRTNRHLTAGPGTLDGLDILFALQPAKVTLFHAKVDATIDIGVSHVLMSTAGTAPGHLASATSATFSGTFHSSPALTVSNP